MEPWREITVDASLFAAIPAIVEHQYVLVRAPDRRIGGIVKTTDLSLQFRQLAEPFLLLGEIENHIRRLIDGKYTLDEVRSAMHFDPDGIPESDLVILQRFAALQQRLQEVGAT